MARRKLTETQRGISSLDQQHTSAEIFSLSNVNVVRPNVKPSSFKNCPFRIRNAQLETVWCWGC